MLIKDEVMMNFKYVSNELLKKHYVVENRDNGLSMYHQEFPIFRFFIQDEGEPILYLVIGTKKFMYNISTVSTDTNIMLFALFNFVCNVKQFKERSIYSLGFSEDNVEFILQTINFNNFEDSEKIILFIEKFYNDYAREIWFIANLSLFALNVPDDYLLKTLDTTNNFDKKISSFINEKSVQNYYSFYREGYLYNFYFDCKSDISIYDFEAAHMGPFYDQISNKFIKGINGYLYKVSYKGNNYDFFIHNKDYKKITKILKAFEIKLYKMISNTNFIFVISTKFLLVYPTTQNNYDLCEFEKQLLFIRQREENIFLNEYLNINFIDHIKGDLFEDLIYDILENDKFKYKNIRFVADTYEPDGGRDLICDAYSSYTNEGFIYIKAIVQCKAYNKNLSKKEVNDIRDLLDHYNTKKYILFSKSKLTKNLTEYLERMNEQGYEVVWYTEREIINEIKKSDYLLKKYKDIIVIENLEDIVVKSK